MSLIVSYRLPVFYVIYEPSDGHFSSNYARTTRNAHAITCSNVTIAGHVIATTPNPSSLI